MALNKYPVRVVSFVISVITERSVKSRVSGIPPHVIIGVTPVNPGRRPVPAGNPNPSVVGGIHPSAVMVRRPAPLVVRMPVPVVIGIYPSSV